MPFTTALIAALIKIVVVVGYIMLAVPMIVWFERKLIADFQARIGPSRVGPFGLLQSFADGIKLVAKESIVPSTVDRLLYFAAPVIIMIPALAVAAVVPFAGDLILNGQVHRMIIADLPVGFLFVLALTSLSVYGIVLAGWASNNKYSLLGGLRSAAQMVSYELPMGLSVVAGLLIAASHGGEGFFNLSLGRVVDTQAGWFWNWAAFNYQFLFLGFVAMITFFIGGLAETNRAPFDLPEAESELIGGYHTEYGGLKWAMFFLGEYAAMLNVAAVTTTLFLGGWHAPYPSDLGGLLKYGSPLYMLHGLAWFGIKIYLIIAFYIHLRASLPRLRYDQLMNFSWKVMLPTTLVNVFALAVLLTLVFPEASPAVLSGRPTPSVPAPQPAPGVGAPPGRPTPGVPVPGQGGIMVPPGPGSGGPMVPPGPGSGGPMIPPGPGSGGPMVPPGPGSGGPIVPPGPPGPGRAPGNSQGGAPLGGR